MYSDAGFKYKNKNDRSSSFQSMREDANVLGRWVSVQEQKRSKHLMFLLGRGVQVQKQERPELFLPIMRVPQMRSSIALPAQKLASLPVVAKLLAKI